MVLLARTTPLEQLNKSHLNRGLSVFYCDFARGKKEGSIIVQPIRKMGGRSVDANQVVLFSFGHISASIIAFLGLF